MVGGIDTALDGFTDASIEATEGELFEAWRKAVAEAGAEDGPRALTTGEVCVLVFGWEKTANNCMRTLARLRPLVARGRIRPTKKKIRNVFGDYQTVGAFVLGDVEAEQVIRQAHHDTSGGAGGCV